MRWHLSHPLICLIVGVALVSLQGMAAAAGVAMLARGPLTEATICADGIAVTLLVDGRGQPVEPAATHPCAKCLAPGAALLPETASPPAAPRGVRRCELPPAVTAAAVRPVLHPARGPPPGKA